MSERRPIRLTAGNLHLETQKRDGTVLVRVIGWTEKHTRYEIELTTGEWLLVTLAQEAARLTRERIEAAEAFRERVEKKWHEEGASE